MQPRRTRKTISVSLYQYEMLRRIADHHQCEITEALDIVMETEFSNNSSIIHPMPEGWEVFISPDNDYSITIKYGDCCHSITREKALLIANQVDDCLKYGNDYLNKKSQETNIKYVKKYAKSYHVFYNTNLSRHEAGLIARILRKLSSQLNE